jgi:protocatechuate 3,4-dioxygenase beta subunit
MPIVPVRSCQGSRRRGLQIAAAAIALPSLLLSARAQAPTPRRATPAQAEGPFYPVAWPADSDSDLLVNGAAARYGRGRAATVEGTLTDTEGRALKGAVIEIWQCDADGRYHHPGDGGRADPTFQGAGRATVDAQGQWRFRTIRPVAYGGRAPHIHLKVRLGTRELLTTQLYVEGDAGNARDFLWQRLSPTERVALTVPFVAMPDGSVQARLPIVVAA